MAQKLRKLRIQRIAFVDQGANPGAHIALCKRKEERMPEPTAAELAARITALEAERDAAVVKATAAETALAKALEKKKEPDPDDVLKGLSPEARAEVIRLRKDADDLRKANGEAAERIAKIESDRNREQMIRKCSQEFKALAPAEDLAGLLLPIAKALPKPEYDDLLKRMAAWNEQIRQSVLFKELGRDRGGEAGSPEAELDTLAKAYEKAHATEEGMTYEIAYSRVLKTTEGKALYKALQSAPPQGGR